MMIGRFDSARMARAFSDYLRKLGIAHRLEVGEHAAELWIDDDAHLEPARRELARFREEPGHPRYLQASWEAPPPPDEIEKISGRYGGAGDLSPAQLLRSRGPVTLVVLFACVAVAFMTSLGENAAAVDAFLFSLTPPWRVFSPALVHFGIVHLVFNLMWWWLLAGVIERFQSSFQLAMLTLGIALVSNVAQFYYSGANFGGLSGVVYGLMGYLWLYGRSNPAAGYQLRPSIVNFMLLWMVLGFTGLVGPVANVAHLSGLLAGCAIGVVFGLYRRRIHYRD